MTALSVLYVDDDPDIRTIVGMALGLDAAMIVTLADSAAEALALVDEGLVPDVAILDVMMPGIDGPALARQLGTRAVTESVPVIFMTAKARDADLALYEAQGAIGAIVKPFDPLGLAQQVRALLAAYQG